jgi:hypothetical protein
MKKRCHFQLYCPFCYESINVVQVDVEVDSTGRPLKKELRRIFQQPNLNAEKCPCCGKKELSKGYSYEKLKHENTSDLPF